MDPGHQNRGDTSRWDSGRTISALSFVWFLTGMLIFGCFALFAFVLNPFATVTAGQSLFEPEGYRTAVFIWHLPMVYGWVPAAYRAFRRKRNPWKYAKGTIVLGVFVGPIVFLVGMLVWRLLLEASASV
ncbi:MAG: hypothetical protein ACI9KE_005339 [Polyangiales bacterium]|jgi:hypothetical protein